MSIGDQVVVVKDIPRNALFPDDSDAIVIPAGERGQIVEEAVWNASKLVKLECRGQHLLFIPTEYLAVVD